MGSDTNNSRLPVIEFTELTNLNTGTSFCKSTSDSVRQALESYGCFVVAYEDEISSELDKAMFDGGLLEELFGLPVETKSKYTSEFAGFGYGGNYSVMPLFEYFGIEDGGTLEAARKFTGVVYPDGHHKLCETIHSYCKLLSRLDNVVMKLVTSSYSLEKYYEPLIQSSFYFSRLMRYRFPSNENESCLGILPHRDKNFMTVIGTNEVKGLEIETRDGEWIDFEPSLGRFIVIVGEAFMAWTNGRVYCPLHRVTAKLGTKEKYSVGLFSFVRGVLHVPEELVDEEHPLKFKSFSNLEFLDYCKEGGTKLKAAIQTYCGI